MHNTITISTAKNLEKRIIQLIHSTSTISMTKNYREKHNTINSYTIVTIRNLEKSIVQLILTEGCDTLFK